MSNLLKRERTKRSVETEDQEKPPREKQIKSMSRSANREVRMGDIATGGQKIQENVEKFSPAMEPRDHHL